MIAPLPKHAKRAVRPARSAILPISSEFRPDGVVPSGGRGADLSVRRRPAGIKPFPSSPAPFPPADLMRRELRMRRAGVVPQNG